MILRQIIIIAVVLFCTVIPAHADGTHARGIQLDGTLGSAGKLSLPGPDYDIKAEYGKQAGANLFHSFQQFNIHSGESATFSGPNSVQSIISRVTGGNASWIDGRLGSAISDADLYFLNPSGVMFGPNACLDLGGSFHASTADYLRMGENNCFYTIPHSDEVMSVAAPAAFGFLDNDNAGITVEGRGKVMAEEFDDTSAGLHVGESRTISLVGGDIEIRKGTHYTRQKTDSAGNPVFRPETDEWTYPMYETETDEHGNPVKNEHGQPVYRLDENGTRIPIYQHDKNGDRIPVMETIYSGAITASGGQIRIASVASAGEVDAGPQVSNFRSRVPESGNIKVSGKSLIDVSGTSAGSVLIRGGQFVSRDASIQARTLGDRDGGVIDIQADTVSLARGARIIGNTQGTGKGSDIVIRAAGTVTVSGKNTEGEESAVYSRTGTYGEHTEDHLGDAGKVLIESGAVSFRDSGGISVSTYGGGEGGDLTIRASESVHFSGNRDKARLSYIAAATYSESEKAGNAGSIEIEAKNISFADGAIITSSAGGRGDGGNVTLTATDLVSFSGENPKGSSRIGILTILDKEGAGNGGTLDISADNISFTDGAFINSDTRGRGSGGKVTLDAANSVIFSGENSRVLHSGIQMTTAYRGKNAGNAGSLEINADNISFAEGAQINSNSRGTGNGGEVRFSVGDSVSFSGKTSEGWGSRIQLTTLYTKEGAGDGGRLLIEADNISFSDDAFIESASIGRGSGGEVILKAAGSVSFVGKDEGKRLSGTRIGMGSLYPGENAGNAGSLEIEAGNISFSDGAYITSATSGRGKGGEVSLKAADSISFMGTDSKSWGSRVELTTDYKKEGGGDGGSLLVEAGEISFEDGAYVTGITYGNGRAGNISLHADKQIRFSGRGEQAGQAVATLSAGVDQESTGGSGGSISLEAQEILVTDGAEITATTSGIGNSGNISISAGTVTVAGADADGSVSRIYAGSESMAENAGAGGKISVSAQTLSLSDGGTISTSGAGGGNAGGIKLDVRQLRLGTNASVSSESTFVNEYIFADISQRDSSTLAPGDVVKVSDAGDGRERSYVCTGNMLELHLVYRARNLSELDEILGRYAVLQGDVAEVADAGDGKPARYIYAYSNDLELEGWVQFDIGDITTTVTGMTEINQIDGVILDAGEGVPGNHSLGDVIRVTDAGDGKPGIFIYSELLHDQGFRWIQPIRLSRFDAADTAALGELTDRFFFKEGDVARISDSGDGKASDFVFCKNEWIKFNNIHEVADMAEADTLIRLQAGTLAYVEDAGGGYPGTFMYSGTDWVAAGEVHAVTDISARDRLPVRTGDVAKVADAGAGNPKSFFYADGVWTEFLGGDAGTVIINSDTVRMENKSRISTSSEGPGKAGDIRMTARQLELSSGSSVLSGSNSESIVSGEGGNIRIRASESVKLSGDLTDGEMSNITVHTKGKGLGAGHAGKVSVEAGEFLLTDGTRVSSSTFGGGKGGEINIRTSGAARFSGTNANGYASRLYSSSYSKEDDAGDAGDILIEADTVSFADGSGITAETAGSGSGGTIEINASDAIELSGVNPHGENQFGFGTGLYVRSTGITENAGTGGDIVLESGSLSLTDGAVITAEAKGAGGGRINVSAGNEIYIVGGNITSSVKQGEGKGGDITANSKFIILNRGEITANTDEGDGGAIFIHADTYIKSSDSRVTATSERGNDGTVKTEAPDVDISSNLVILPGTFLDAARWMKKSCADRSRENKSSFVIKKHAVPRSFDDLQPGPILWFENKDDKKEVE